MHRGHRRASRRAAVLLSLTVVHLILDVDQYGNSGWEADRHAEAATQLASSSDPLRLCEPWGCWVGALARRRTSTLDPAEIDRLARPGRARRGAARPPTWSCPRPSPPSTRACPWYRGLAVTDLAGTRTFEEVAEWLWTARFPAPPGPGGRCRGGRARRRWMRVGGPRPPLPGTALPLERIQVIAAALAAGDELRLELRPAAVTAAGGP